MDQSYDGDFEHNLQSPTNNNNNNLSNNYRHQEEEVDTYPEASAVTSPYRSSSALSSQLDTSFTSSITNNNINNNNSNHVNNQSYYQDVPSTNHSAPYHQYSSLPASISSSSSSLPSSANVPHSSLYNLPASSAPSTASYHPLASSPHSSMTNLHSSSTSSPVATSHAHSSSPVLSSPAGAENKDQVIAKLKQMNSQLRTKFKEFSQTLDHSIYNASGGKVALGAVNSMLRSPSQLANMGADGDVATLTMENRNLHKKLTIYKREIDALRSKFEVAGSADRLMQLESQIALRNRELEELAAENRLLKKIQARSEKEKGPAVFSEQSEQRVASLVDENRALKDKLREMQQRHEADEKSARRQQEQMVKYQNHMRSLEEKIRNLELTRGPAPQSDDAHLLQQFEAERVQFHRQIEDLQNKAANAIGSKNVLENTVKKLKSELKVIQTELDTTKATLHEREYEFRRMDQKVQSMSLQLLTAQSGKAVNSSTATLSPTAQTEPQTFNSSSSSSSTGSKAAVKKRLDNSKSPQPSKTLSPSGKPSKSSSNDTSSTENDNYEEDFS